MICDLSDLPVEQCACRIHGPKDDISGSHPFPARFPGTCLACEEDIGLGDRIVREPSGSYVHEECST